MLSIKKIKLLCFSFALICSIQPISANKVEVSLNDSTFTIGDIVELKLSYNSNKLNNIIFPFIDNSSFNGLELISNNFKLDTIYNEKTKLYTRNLNIQLSAYKEGTYTIPAFRFSFPNEGLKPNSLIKDVQSSNNVFSDSLRVYFFEPQVDTSADIMAISNIIEVSKVELAKEYLKLYYPYLLGLLGLVAIIIAIIYAIKKYKSKKPIISLPKKPTIPPRERALKLLKELHEKRLWQQNLIKEYYTELTDIIKKFIEEEYAILAVEMTSYDLLDTIKEVLPDEKDRLKELTTILSTADLAKFAKNKPHELEHENSYLFAANFIEKGFTTFVKPKNIDSKSLEENAHVDNNDNSTNIDNAKIGSIGEDNKGSLVNDIAQIENIDVDLLQTDSLEEDNAIQTENINEDLVQADSIENSSNDGNNNSTTVDDSTQDDKEERKGDI